MLNRFIFVVAFLFLVLPQVSQAAFDFTFVDASQRYLAENNQSIPIVAENHYEYLYIGQTDAPTCNSVAAAAGLSDSNNYWCLQTMVLFSLDLSCVYLCQNVAGNSGAVGGGSNGGINTYIFSQAPLGVPVDQTQYPYGCLSFVFTVGPGQTDYGCNLMYHAPNPTVTLSVNPSSIYAGSASVLTWNATNATSCVGSGFTATNNSTFGSVSVSPSSTTQYSITCTGTRGAASGTATVTVSPAPLPTVTLNLTPSSISSGSSSTISWSSVNATSCTGTNFSTGNNTNGTASTGAITSNKTYSVICTGLGGNASASATITVNALPTPVVTLTASPSSINNGSSSTLTWSSANAVLCTGTGFDTSGLTAGSVSVSPSATRSYSILCTGAGGTSTGTWQYSYSDTSDFACPLTDPNRAYTSVPACPSNPAGKTCTTGICRVNSISACNILTDIYTCSAASPAPSAGASATVLVTNPVAGSCSVTPTSIYTNGSATWSAVPSGGTGSYVYSWSGADGLSGATASVSKTYTTSGVKTGSVVITSGGSSKSINCSNSVAVSVILSDLTAGVTAPLSAVAGTATTFSSTIRNVGQPATGGGFVNLFQRATDANGANAVDVGTGSSPNISANGSAVTSVSYVFPSAGTWYMRACADKNSSESLGTVNESNENNNCSAWTAVTVTNPPLNASCRVSPSFGYTGDTFTWVATATGGTGSYTYLWSGTDSLSGNSASVNKTYSSAGNKSGSVAVTSGSQTVTSACINSASVTMLPSVVITATPNNIIRGGGTDITWTANSAVSCSGTNFNTLGATSGSVTVSPTASTTYSITCSQGTRSAVSTATVTVYIADLTLNVSPALTVRKGDLVTVVWSVAGTPDSCTMQGPGLSSTALSGSQQVAISQESVYTLTCNAGSSSTSKKVIVKLVPAFEEF